MAFPRSVIFEACRFLGDTIGYHGAFEDMVLGWGLAARGETPRRTETVQAPD